MIYFTADYHFSHENIIKYCNRPFKNLDHMHDILIKNWNKVVNNDDKIIVCGDFGFFGVKLGKKIVDQLNGYKIIIRGNHDESRNRLFRMGFNEVYDEIQFAYSGHKLRFSHFPYYPTLWERMKSKLKGIRIRCLSERPIKNVDPNIWLVHGHVHDSWGQINVRKQMINVSCDVWKFKPISINEIIGLIRRSKHV